VSQLTEDLKAVQVVQQLEQRQVESAGQMDQLTSLPIDSIVPNPYQPRIRFNEEKLKELAETIRQKGLIQPIVVRRNSGRYEIVSGERRWQASRMANLASINVVIKPVDDQSMLEMAIIENLEREDLTAIEMAKAIKILQERFHLTQDEIAGKLSKDRSTISNLSRLLSLPDDVQRMLLDGQIEFGHAKAILSVGDEDGRQELANRIVSGGWSVRRAEEESRRMSAGDGLARSADSVPSENEWESLEQEMSGHLGSAVRVKIRRVGTGFKGSVEIRIHGTEDVDRILGIFRKGSLETRYRPAPSGN